MMTLDHIKTRFEDTAHAHPQLQWEDVAPLLDDDALTAFDAMDASGGEPTIVVFPEHLGGICLVDFCKESPKARRSFCYDKKALDGRKANPPKSDVETEVKTMGVELLSEEAYRFLQDIMPFDEKTSSWVLTPAPIREKGGAIFCDRRFDHVFTYHNGAESYYGSRGFRTLYRLTQKAPH